jgi:hypothetical protein
VLDRTKRVECRLSITRRAPYGYVSVGQRIALVATGGHGACVATCKRVKSFEGLTPAGLARIKQRYNKHILAPHALWQANRDARYTTLTWLGDFEPLTVFPDYNAIPHASARSA